MSNNPQGFNEYVRSDSAYVNESMQILKNQLDKSIDYCQSNDPAVYSSDVNNKLYSKMNDVMNSYTVAQKNIMEKLKNELEFAKQVGETYDELDKSIEGDAKRL